METCAQKGNQPVNRIQTSTRFLGPTPGTVEHVEISTTLVTRTTVYRCVAWLTDYEYRMLGMRVILRNQIEIINLRIIGRCWP